jgi:CDP-2,3-bis-(O-geranylgeranyl)-sn-glycerol synthase
VGIPIPGKDEQHGRGRQATPADQIREVPHITASKDLTMQYTAIGQFLFLLVVANGAPIIARDLLKAHGNSPIDGGRTWYDGRPLLGPAKTVRGLLAAGIATGGAAPLVGRPLLLGVLLGLCAMGGDLLSSCLKRRLGITSSESALGLDQSLEALGPALALRTSFAFQAADVVTAVLAFFVVAIGLSRVLYRLHLRDRPV